MNDDFPAVVICHTPTGPTPCCTKHARQLAALMSIMGSHVHEEKAPEGAQCTNCVNAAARVNREGSGPRG